MFQVSSAQNTPAAGYSSPHLPGGLALQRGAPTPSGGGRRSTKPKDAGTERGRAGAQFGAGAGGSGAPLGVLRGPAVAESICYRIAVPLAMHIRAGARCSEILSARLLTTSVVSARSQSSSPLIALSSRSFSSPHAPSPVKPAAGFPEGVASLLRLALQYNSGTHYHTVPLKPTAPFKYDHQVYCGNQYQKRRCLAARRRY